MFSFNFNWGLKGVGRGIAACEAGKRGVCGNMLKA